MNRTSSALKTAFSASANAGGSAAGVGKVLRSVLDIVVVPYALALTVCFVTTAGLYKAHDKIRPDSLWPATSLLMPENKPARAPVAPFIAGVGSAVATLAGALYVRKQDTSRAVPLLEKAEP